MTRKRVGQGLLEAFSTTCEHCNGRGRDVHLEPVEHKGAAAPRRTNAPVAGDAGQPPRSVPEPKDPETEAKEAAAKAALIKVAEATLHAHEAEANRRSAEP